MSAAAAGPDGPRRGEDVRWPPLLVISVLAVALTAAGLLAFRRRDLATIA